MVRRGSGVRVPASASRVRPTKGPFVVSAVEVRSPRSPLAHRRSRDPRARSALAGPEVTEYPAEGSDSNPDAGVVGCGPELPGISLHVEELALSSLVLDVEPARGPHRAPGRDARLGAACPPSRVLTCPRAPCPAVV